jgi:hypothetical protein
MLLKYRLPFLFAVSMLASAAHAYNVQQNVAFSVVNQNPWTAGPSFFESWVNRDLSASLAVPVPNVNLSPTGEVLKLIGLPEIGFARIGGSLVGSAALELGYVVDGGRMNLQYPGVGRIDFATQPNTNYISALGATRTNTSWQTGFNRELIAAVPDLVRIGGIGYDPARSIPGQGLGRMQAPGFQTYFPQAAAWATFEWSASASLVTQAGLLRTRNPFDPDEIICFGCVQKSVNLGTWDGAAKLIDVNKKGVEVIGLGRQPLFGSDINLGAGSVRVDYPDVSVKGTLKGASQLTGTDAKPIISFNGNLEQLVPLLGPFLRQGVPFTPLEVKLLGVSGGPTLSLYQDFEVNLKPELKLTFGTPVAWRKPDGSRAITNEIRVAVGESFDWSPIIGGAGGRIEAKPTYVLGGKVTNRTGLALGYDVKVDALEVDLGFETLGPLEVARLRNDAAIRLAPFYAPEPFALTPTTVDTARFSLNALSPIFRDGVQVGDVPVSLQDYSILGLGDGGTRVRLNLVAERPRQFGFSGKAVEVTGQIRQLLSPFYDNVLQTVLELPQDLRITDWAGYDVALGNLICLYCPDGSSQFGDPSPSFVDGIDQVYINTLAEGEFRADDPSRPDAPLLNGRTTDLATLRGPAWEVGATVAASDFGFGPTPAVPEPANAVMLLGGLVALGAWLRRRARQSVPTSLGRGPRPSDIPCESLLIATNPSPVKSRAMPTSGKASAGRSGQCKFAKFLIYQISCQRWVCADPRDENFQRIGSPLKPSTQQLS